MKKQTLSQELHAIHEDMSKFRKRWLRFYKSEVETSHKFPSMTEPDQVNDLEKILAQRQNGMPIPTFNGVFASTHTPDISGMDFVELAQLRETTAAQITAAEQDIHAINVQIAELQKPKPAEAPKELPKSDDQQ